MSWFDTAGIASFAKSALSSAQKTIDKALDIQEKSNEEDKHVQFKQIEADSFFEAFGLNEKPYTSQPALKPPDKPNVSAATSSNPRQEEPPMSGFWGDSWGSFFEIKGQIPSQPRKKNKNPDKSVVTAESNQKKEDAVLLQPFRASPFPTDSSSSKAKNTEEMTQEDRESTPSEDISVTTMPTEGKQSTDTLEKITDEVSTHSDSEETLVPVIVTEQPSSEQKPPSSIASSTNDSSANLESPSKLDCEPTLDKNEETSCDKPANDSSTGCLNSPLEVPTQPITHGERVCNFNDSESVNLSSSAKDAKSSEESKCNPDCDSNVGSNNVMNISSGSFTQLEPSEVNSLSKDFSFNSNSTLVIPDIPDGASINVSNWECCPTDALPSELFTPVDNASNDFLGTKHEPSVTNAEPQCSKTGNSFPEISVENFHVWTKPQKSSQSTEESPDSSNGEPHSSHSDGSSKDDDEVKECDAKSTSSSGSHTTSSSFVKCSVEENENSHRGQSPVSTTASERSDVTKQESEQNTSGDENETATSSDIEILSPPNGENGDRNASPLKNVWLSRPLRFRRSESPTSDSSKDSMMPVVSELEEVSYEDETGSSLYSEKELGCTKDYSNDNLGSLLQKQDELQAILDAREKKVIELSKENIELQENEQRLKNLIQKMRVEQAKESRDITSLTREFSQKLSNVEGQLKKTIEERNYLQNELEELKQNLNEQIPTAEFEKVVKEKDQEIAELLEEGQKLSKKELQHSNIIKKLRAKVTENDKTIKSQSERLDENSKEVDRLRKSIDAKEDQEKKHIDIIRNTTSALSKLEKEVSQLKSDLEDRTEKELSLKKSLDSTYKDLTELKKAYAAKEKEVEELKSGIGTQENLQQMLDNANKDALREKESLLLQMQELRSTLSRAEEEANSRERMFKAEIASLQKRLQEAEERNEDLSKNMSSATRPLIRQIENLQATFTTQTISWEKIEKNLTDRLSDAENQVALVTEKERAATEKYLEFQSKLTGLELQNSTLRQEKLKLSAEIEALKADIVVLEENKNRETYTLEKVKQNFNSEIKKIKQEKANLETTMATCLEQLDFEKRKVHKLEEEIKMKDIRASIISNSSPCPSPTGSARSSVSSMHNWSQDESHDHGMVTPINSYRMSVYDSLRLGSGSSLLENLQSQLKQREGEIIQLQSEISKLEHVKESMTQELVLLTEQNEELDKKVDKLGAVEKEYKDLDQKYNTLLQMYGEKVEETEELQLDLADVKSMYKAQIEELLMNK